MAKIHSIYSATEGEGVRLGTAQVFVRFQGCAVGCKNCDSKETWDFRQGEELLLEQIVQQIENYGLVWVSITGGDPLDVHHRTEVSALIDLLHKSRKKINIEVTGQSLDLEIFHKCDFISYDIKTPSTGITAPTDLLAMFIRQFGEKSQLKCVISDKNDFDFAYQCYNQYAEIGPISWVMTPASSTEAPLILSNFIKIMEWNQMRGGAFRVIGQQHKWVYGQQRLDV